MQTLFEKLQDVFNHFSKLRAERFGAQVGELSPEEEKEIKEEVKNECSVLHNVSLSA